MYILSVLLVFSCKQFRYGYTVGFNGKWKLALFFLTINFLVHIRTHEHRWTIRFRDKCRSTSWSILDSSAWLRWMWHSACTTIGHTTVRTWPISTNNQFAQLWCWSATGCRKFNIYFLQYNLLKSTFKKKTKIKTKEIQKFWKYISTKNKKQNHVYSTHKHTHFLRVWLIQMWWLYNSSFQTLSSHFLYKQYVYIQLLFT